MPAGPADVAALAAALAGYRAGAAEARPLTLVYAPVTVNLPAPATAPAPFPAAQGAPPPALPGPLAAAAFARPARYGTGLAEWVFRLGVLVMAGGALDAVAEMAAGHPSFLLGIAPSVGGLLTLSGAAGMNHTERAR
jgi:hypothetical protein